MEVSGISAGSYVPADPHAPEGPYAPESPDSPYVPEAAGAPRGGRFGGRTAGPVGGRARLRAVVATPPGRLCLLGAVLAALLVAFGAVTALEVTGRSSAAGEVVGRSQPLSADAAHLYRSLADADTVAAGGFLAGAQEPADLRERYDADVATAARLLVKAAADAGAGGAGGPSRSADEIATLNEQLPVYTGLVERARAANRQGLPLGGAYLRYANAHMTTDLLPAAQRLYAAETARLAEDERRARAWPAPSLALGALALAALAAAQWRDYRRTHRVLNPGLVAAAAATAAALLWLAGAHTLARAGLDDARVHGLDSLKVLNEARIGSLKARANENLTLVARGAVLTDDGRSDKYETDHGVAMAGLDRALAGARGLADDEAGRAAVEEAARWSTEWRERHAAARRTNDEGDYDGALARVVGGGPSTGAAFDRVDAALRTAVDHEQSEFTRAAARGRDVLAGLPTGAAVLAAVAAVAAVAGVNRRLAEYR
ncbi:hypothetical protein [Streptomyces kanasensis]|uniref:hypothetical protein n=1 Tax=Streptomyces kanasensis TaxID=936756 RepID=UPI0036FC4F37